MYIEKINLNLVFSFFIFFIYLCSNIGDINDNKIYQIQIHFRTYSF